MVKINQRTVNPLTAVCWCIDPQNLSTCHGWPANHPTLFYHSAMNGRSIGQTNNTYLAWMVDKTALGLPTVERVKVIFIYTRFSTYRWKLSFLVLRFKNFVYTLTLYFRWGRNYKSNPAKLEYKKSPCQTLTKKKPPCQFKVCKKLSLCQLEVSKKTL